MLHQERYKRTNRLTRSVEINPDACNTLKTRTAFHFLNKIGKQKLYYDYLYGKITRDQLWDSVPKNLIESVINIEISKQNLDSIFNIIDGSLNERNVDIIIGGPPCQAYSIVGRARDPKGMQDDPRNHLYKYYVSFLKKYNPKMFVFENVPGLLSAKNGEFLKKILNAIKRARMRYQSLINNYPLQLCEFPVPFLFH